MRVVVHFWCAGGASDGLVRAGIEVVGVDHEPQPEYPHTFIQADALAFDVSGFDGIWASPPCQAFTAYKRRTGHVREALNLIPETRAKLVASGKPYVIENVVGAPVLDPAMLCGSMFGLDVQRHRILETSFPVPQMPCRHDVWTPRFPGATNRAPNSRKTVEVGVYRIPVETQRKAMGVDRPVSLPKLSQMVPPAYSQWLGSLMATHILMQQRRAA